MSGPGPWPARRRITIGLQKRLQSHPMWLTTRIQPSIRNSSTFSNRSYGDGGEAAGAGRLTRLRERLAEGVRWRTEVGSTRPAMGLGVIARSCMAMRCGTAGRRDSPELAPWPWLLGDGIAREAESRATHFGETAIDPLPTPVLRRPGSPVERAADTRRGHELRILRSEFGARLRGPARIFPSREPGAGGQQRGTACSSRSTSGAGQPPVAPGPGCPRTGAPWPRSEG